MIETAQNRNRVPFVLKGLAILSVAIVSAVTIFQLVIAPWIVRYALGTLITKPCHHCTLEIQAIHINLFGPTVSLHEVKFSARVGDATMLSAHIPYVVADMYPLPLLKKKLHLGPIKLINPAVSVLEREQPPPAPSPKPEKKGETSRVTTVEFAGVDVVDGDFTYVHEKEAVPAAVRVHKIDLSLDRLGNTAELIEQRARWSATGILEHSGKFTLTVAPVLFSEMPNVDVELKISGLELFDLNEFFMHEDGIGLKGTLLHGESHVDVRNLQAHSVATAKFENLKFELNPTKKRSFIESFFTGLVAGVKMGSHNLYDTLEERTQTIEAKRNPEESLLAFILRAMKEAALKIPSREGKPAFDAQHPDY